MQQEPKSPRERAADLIDLISRSASDLASDLVPHWRPTREQVVWTVRILIALVFLQALFFLAGSWLWEVLVNYVAPRNPSNRKDVVNVFVLIGAGVVGFLTVTAAVGNLYISRRNLQQQRELEAERSQDDALQAYYTQLGDLLTEHDLKKTKPDDDVALLARAQTLTVVGRVNAVRKGALVAFLYGAGLINKYNRIVDLTGADLFGASALGADLHGADLSGVFLSDATLSYTDLRNTNLSGAHLVEANLGSADLSGADLSGAILIRTNFRGANLSDADLSGAIGKDDYIELWMQAESLEGTIMPDGQKYEF